jgi:hypothetical protein
MYLSPLKTEKVANLSSHADIAFVVDAQPLEYSFKMVYKSC